MSARLDITSEVCPMTYVRVKVRLEQLEDGAHLQVRLRGPEPLKNVPANARDEGHEVVSLEPEPTAQDVWLLVLKKSGGPTAHLQEIQVQRYSRQVLVPEVGGRGQHALRALGARCGDSGGPALDVAVAYLAAGGTPVRPIHPEPFDRLGAGKSRDHGSWVPRLRFATLGMNGASDLGFLPGAGADALAALNPDAVHAAATTGWLGERPAHPEGPLPWVIIGWAGARGGVAFAGPEGCPNCLIATASALTPRPIASAATVAVGAMAALAFQGCALGRLRSVGGVWIDRTGAVSEMSLSRCAEHR